jgi:Zn-dependent protease with chaperone function
MVLTLLAAMLGANLLPPDHLSIAMKVAGQGLPQCRMYRPDGSEGPCLPSFAVSPGNAINGRSAAGHITFTEGTTTRLTADEFALLAGHEIAHWYLGHTKSTREAELAADRLGAQLACQAGYDVAKGVSVYRFIGKSRVHPDRAVRRAVVLGVGCASGGTNALSL